METPEDFRQLTFSIAYRMLGSVSEAEDVVQETFLRYYQAQERGVVVESLKAYLAAVVTRLSIDHFRSARVRREAYVGEWLPEPIVEERTADVTRSVEAAESLSMAFLSILETLSPVERAVFLLREAFDYEYDEIAGIVEKSQDNCRQLFARAKRRLDSGKPRFEASREKRDEIARRFFAACENGSLGDFEQLLAADAVFYGDGGGKVNGVTRPVYGQDRVARLIHGIFAKGQQFGVRLQPAEVNGQPGAIILDSQERLISVFALDIADGRVTAIRSVVNPEKLGHLGPLSDLTRRAPRQ